eukprot:TRINITY_DN10832_c0_g1_i1.p1 TRINITY_DN10832_c0_g1~~TRINITY_DN10832_c0_g1_i1.p1  ORF type:complete len:353 (+),score=80.34 TRINITY_DN10832_c0_g1_i1:155-1213(+)
MSPTKESWFWFSCSGRMNFLLEISFKFQLWRVKTMQTNSTHTKTHSIMNMNIDAGLLKFCLEHSDGSVGPSNLPQRDPQDYVWLREALNNLESDADRMKKLLLTIQDQQKPEGERAFALEELQYLVEDIDNSNDLYKINGFVPIINLLNDPSAIFRYWAAWIISTLVQNNPKSQDLAMNNGIIPLLLTRISSETDNQPLAKVLGATSSLLSNNKRAQEAFRDSQLLPSVANILERNEVDASAKTRAILVLKNFGAGSVDLRKAVVKDGKALEILPKLLNNDNDQLREQALGLLSVLLDDKANVAKVRNSDIVEKIKKRETDIGSLTGEELEAHETELDLCKNLLAKLAQAKK